MRNLASSLLVFFISILPIVFFACRKKENPEIKDIKIFKSTPVNDDAVKHEVKPVNKEIQIHSDTLSIPVKDSVSTPELLPDSTESTAQPLRKPTFKHFYRYVNLHRKSPIS